MTDRFHLSSNILATSTQHDGRECISGTSKPMIFGEYADWDFGGGRDRCGRNSESGMTKLARNHYWSLNANRAHEDLQAEAVWTAIDYQSGGVTRSKAIDWARLPKFSAFFYQSSARSIGDNRWREFRPYGVHHELVDSVVTNTNQSFQQLRPRATLA